MGYIMNRRGPALWFSSEKNLKAGIEVTNLQEISVSLIVIIVTFILVIYLTLHSNLM